MSCPYSFSYGSESLSIITATNNLNSANQMQGRDPFCVEAQYQNAQQFARVVCSDKQAVINESLRLTSGIVFFQREPHLSLLIQCQSKNHCTGFVLETQTAPHAMLAR